MISHSFPVLHFFTNDAAGRNSYVIIFISGRIDDNNIVSLLAIYPQTTPLSPDG